MKTYPLKTGLGWVGSTYSEYLPRHEKPRYANNCGGLKGVGRFIRWGG